MRAVWLSFCASSWTIPTWLVRAPPKTAACARPAPRATPAAVTHEGARAEAGERSRGGLRGVSVSGSCRGRRSVQHLGHLLSGVVGRLATSRSLCRLPGSRQLFFYLRLLRSKAAAGLLSTRLAATEQPLLNHRHNQLPALGVD